jgi:hypothetical protein
METKKVYLNDDDLGSLVCDQCGKQKLVDASQFGGKLGPFKAKCPCGHVFSFAFEKRRQYRKTVDLAGQYVREDPTREVGEMIVEDVSKTGISFKVQNKTTSLQIDDILKTRFVLDDANRSVISKNVVVRRVKGLNIGAEFCDNQLDKRLAFYLMA